MKIVNCPSCHKRMTVTHLQCSTCGIEVKGAFTADRYGRLDEEALDFMETFILSRGSIKEVEKRLGISYPTVKAKLDRLVAAMEQVKREEAEAVKKEEQMRSEQSVRDTRVRTITIKQ